MLVIALYVQSFIQGNINTNDFYHYYKILQYNVVFIFNKYFMK